MDSTPKILTNIVKEGELSRQEINVIVKLINQVYLLTEKDKITIKISYKSIAIASTLIARTKDERSQIKNVIKFLRHKHE